jgi:two-component system CheB/CheR fusion protein
MVLHKIETLEDYLHFVQGNTAEVHSLYQDLLIHVTRFFRDGESFEALAETVFANLTGDGRDRADDPIRIWVPGCSTGEEAYSIAIALLEHLGDDANATPVQIFATDVSEAAIERARAGIYQENISADVSSERLRRFFSRIDGSYRVNKQIRDMCIFARQDLTRDPPFFKLDLIVCRNVMIYLGAVLQRRLVTVFHYALKPGGYLMLGSAESIGTHLDLFEAVEKRHKIFAKKAASAPRDMNFPSGHIPMANRNPRPSEPRGITGVQNDANRIVLSRYSPPAVLVDSDLRIVQFRGHTGAYLEPAPGDANLDLLKMAREGLLYGLRSAVTEARKNGSPARKEGLRVQHEGAALEVDVEVIPLNAGGDGRFFLILFESTRGTGGRAKRKPAKPAPEPAKGGKVKKDEVARLERELAASREYLQSMIQDLEAANEELQSANEEILSANEELQSTNEELDTAKEELQSTNEELNTVNEELQGRNEELSRANSDLVNLLGSVQIAIVMVTNDLRIRRFTPMAEKVLNLIPTDVGRPIGDIKPNLECSPLEKLIADCIDSVSIKEHECRDRSGNPYLLRIRPYKSVENRIDGAVLVLFDLSETARRYDEGKGQ